MRYFFDTEFFEHAEGGHAHIELISLGMVCEDGRELYLENREFDWERPSVDLGWLNEHVRPYLQGAGSASWLTPIEIANALREFVSDPAPELWAYVAAYDWVVLISVFGSLLARPEGWPKFCRDLKQLIVERGVTRDMLPPDPEDAHFALADAHWNLSVYRQLASAPTD